jgi:hypothetical protein
MLSFALRLMEELKVFCFHSVAGDDEWLDG